tara:strand:+ start:8843 stop:9829 length:987 start_codon:yes stop_codon:yes gene_type:complete
MRKIVFILSFAVIFGYRDIPDVVTKVGTAAAEWLKLETGIRAAGMSGAQVASGRGVSSISYNPSSLGYIESQEAYFNKTNYLAGVTHNVAGYAKRINATDIIGFQTFFLDSGYMDERDENAQYKGQFKLYGLAIQGTYTKIFTDRLKVGISFKYIRESVKANYLQGFAVDIGSNFDTGIYGLVLGMSVTNFGPEVQYKGDDLIKPSSNPNQLEGKTQPYPLPMTFRLGFEKQFLGSREDALIKSSVHSLTFAADGIKPIDYTVYGCMGAEYSFADMFFLRFGTHFSHDTKGPSVGFGVNLKGIKIDYAFTHYYENLGNEGQFGIEVDF